MVNVRQLFRSPSYLASQLAAEQAYRRLLEEGHDVVLPPVETPAPVDTRGAALYSESSGNWANDWLIGGLIDKVKAQAKGKVLIQIVDTGYQAVNKYISPFFEKGLSTEHVGETGADGNGHAHLCAGNLFADHPTLPMGIIRELAKAGLVRFSFHRGLRANGSGSYGQICDAIDGAMNVQAAGYTGRILSMSFGGPSPYQRMQDLLDQARGAGLFLSAAAGNSGDGSPDTMGYPAKYDSVLGWGALDSNGNRAYYSSIGPGIYGATPGSNILSTTNTADGLAFWNGTSGANPHAVGIMACIMLMYPEVNRQDVMEYFMREYMEDLAAPGFDNYTGYGAPKLVGYFDRLPDDEPGDDPEPDPDPEPTPDPPATRNERPVTIDLPGPWVMYWRTTTEARMRRLELRNARLRLITDRYTPDVADSLKAHLDTFFTNRGLIIPEGEDYQDATNWSQYFLDMFYKENLSLEVLEIQGSDELGRPVTITEDQVTKWNRKINRLRFLPAHQINYNPEL